jgi:endonuclease YncB( thermonuclease family)
MASPSTAGELHAYTNAILIDSPYNDGDSFQVNINGSNITIRLYFADCPETSVSRNTDARRVRSQTRYFGVPSHRETIFFGKEATKFTKQQLSKPFTLYTALASAPGRSPHGRFFGFIKTADGEDLASLLVANGYARAYGVARKTPSGIRHEEMAARLNDMESAAMLARKGIWKATDVNQLATLRALERQENAELRQILDYVRVPLKPININTATKEELRLLPGVGPVLSNRIILNRPYTNNDDLLKITGITEHVMKKIYPNLAKFK